MSERPDESSTLSSTLEATPVTPAHRSRWSIFWTPPWLRWDLETNHDMTWGQNIGFAFTAAFTVANLYYNHPILNILADDFGVTDEQAALVPTIMQAGYAGGLLFVAPIGDIGHRRPMVLILVFCTALLWLGLTLTESFWIFLSLSFVVGILTVTPQLMFPVVAQFAPQRHRVTMISIVMSGIIFGVQIARLLSGILTEYASWRYVYWMSFGLQIAIFIMLLLLMPDYPVLWPGTSYSGILRTIVKLPFRHSLLIQHGMIAFTTMAVFLCFWTTLTFQLAGPPFNLKTLTIGLFALIGLTPMFLNPVVSRILTSRIHPTGTLVFAHLATLAAVTIGTFIGTFSLAGPIICAFLGDLGVSTIIVANRIAIANVDPKAQNAVNSVYMVLTFCGQLVGSAVGNALYAHCGWIYSGSFMITMVLTGLVVLSIKGPHETGWYGWSGGWDLSLKKTDEAISSAEDVEVNTNSPPESEWKHTQTSTTDDRAGPEPNKVVIWRA